MVNLLGQIVDEPAIVQALSPANASPPNSQVSYIPLLSGMVNLLGQIVDVPAIVQALSPANASPPNSQVSLYSIAVWHGEPTGSDSG